jgi:hypothetical protein
VSRDRRTGRRLPSRWIDTGATVAWGPYAGERIAVAVYRQRIWIRAGRRRIAMHARGLWTLLAREDVA